MVRAAVCGTEGRQFESVPVYQKMNKEKKLQASLPKGFKDRWGEELNLKNKLVDTIKDVFINYSFEQLETPEFEKSENIGSFLAEDETNPMSDVFSFVNEKAVSYTHLRAHETRGNLVCRLLLEKKKCYLQSNE